MDARLIIDPPAAGDWNMAVDETLLESARTGAPSLRFYSWLSPTISLGYFQSHTHRMLHSASQNCEWVRRSTGGGAIVHDREITYSYSCQAQSRTNPDPVQLYLQFHKALISELLHWGMAADLCQVDAVSETPFLCFLRRSVGDVLLGDHKICGSAQRRDRGALLIHGSVLMRASPKAAELPGIVDLSGMPIDTEALRWGWSNRVGNALGITLKRSALTSDECRRSEEIRLGRYASTSWNEKR